MKKALKPIIIGLTGPIAAGKNTAANVLKRHGAYVIDVDRIGHQEIAPQSDVWRKIVRAFGTNILNKGGIINRTKLGRIAFSDPKKLKRLNAITHPAILREVKTLINNAKRLKRRFIVVNAAVLREIGLIPYVDRVIVILASMKKRLIRLISLGNTKKEAILKIRAQRSDQQYRNISDHVISNNGSKVDLQKRLEELILKLG